MRRFQRAPLGSKPNFRLADAPGSFVTASDTGQQLSVYLAQGLLQKGRRFI
jgi:hypothetical protein